VNRKMLIAAMAVALLGVAGPAAAHGDVAIGDSYFEPQTLTVAPGKTVLWGHDGSLPHSVTADDGSFDSSPNCNPSAPALCMQPGMEFEHTFLQTGTFPYHCKVHPGMNGVIRVVNPWDIASEIDDLGAAVSAGSISVAGEATFGGEAPVTVATDPAGDGPIAPQAGSTTGVDLLEARMHQPDPNVARLAVEWKVAGLPETGGIPEGTRYNLNFKINNPAGGKSVFTASAKFSNVASVSATDDPPGHVTHVGNAFQLRGNCTNNWNDTGVAYCYHLGWLDGEFNTVTDTVRVYVPIGSSIAPQIAPGARLLRNDDGNANLTKVIAGYQAVAALSPQTNDEADFGDDDTFAYVVPTEEVSLGIAPAGTPESGVAFTSPATVADGSFTGSLNTAGLAPGSYDVWAKACFGGNCGTAFTRVTI